MLGIDQNTHLLFEGVRNYGHGVWPAPVLSAATLISGENEWGNIPSSRHLADAHMIFREDSFDPVTRLRRGRLYERINGGYTKWLVPPHPADPTDQLSIGDDGLLRRELMTFAPVPNLASRCTHHTSLHMVLGTQAAPTVWRILSVETILAVEELITLQARSTFGALPDLIEDAIPAAARSEVTPALEQVASAAFRSSPFALIEQCRPAFTLVLSNWLADQGETADDLATRDLGGLIKLIDGRCQNQTDYRALKAAIHLVQRFHSRGKPPEQKRYNLRPPNEADAQLVLQALGFVLREIGWAR
jgi:hypothetical protein